MAGERRPEHKHGNRGARSFAKPHVEIEQRMKPEFIEHQAMPGLGRSVPGADMIKPIGAELRKRRDCGGRDEPVDQRRYLRVSRGEARTEKCGELAPAERRSDAQRIAENCRMTGEGFVDHYLLAPPPLFVDASAMTGEAQPAAAE